MHEAKAYLRLFQPDSADYTPRQLRKIIDRELEKEEPDADLIEDCLDALAARQTAKKPAMLPLYKGARIALAAALSVLLLFGTVAAAGQIFGFDLLDGIVEFFDDRIRIHTEKGANTVPAAVLPDAVLEQELASHGLPGVHLPAVFFTEAYTRSNAVYETQDFITAATIPVSSKDVKGTVVITRYAEASALPTVDYPAAKDPAHITVSGIDVYIFGNAEGSVITYTVERTVYTVVLDCAADIAAEIANTVK